MPRTLAETRMTDDTDPSRAALAVAQRFLLSPESEPPQPASLLAELTKAFGAPSAGLAALPDGQPRFFFPAAEEAPPSWPDDPSLLEQTRQAPGAVGVAEGD